MKTTIKINGLDVEFTDQKPTKPGAYWYMHPERRGGIGMKKQFNREVHISTFAGNKYCAELREDDRVVFRVIFDSITRYHFMISDWQYGKSWTYFNLLFVMTPKCYQKNFRYTFNEDLLKE